MRKLACLCLLAVAAGGCNRSLAVKDPIARVVAVQLAEQTPEGSKVNVMVELTNPNKIPLPLVAGDYTVNVAGARSFSHSEKLYRTIPSLGRQIVELPAVFGGQHAGGAYNLHGAISYQPPGEIRKLLTDSGIPLPSSGFSAKGTLEEQAASR